MRSHLAAVLGAILIPGFLVWPSSGSGGAPSAHKEEAPALWAGLTPGPYPVGYHRLETANGVLHAWYPAAAGGGPLAFRDVLGDEGEALASFLAGTKVDSATIAGLLESPLYAGTSPAPLREAFPLVLVAQGNGEDAGDQVVLCEYLASRGLVVASTPSPMLQTPLTREDQVGELAERQAADLAAAVGPVAAFTGADTLRLGAVGHSFGARAALLFAMSHPGLRALVSLDGGIGTATAVEAFRTAPSFDESAPLPPMLHFYEKLDAFMAPDFGLLESLHSSSLALRSTTAMHHVHFTTYGFAAGAFPTLATVTHATPDTAPGAAAVAQQTAAFLLRYLRRPGEHDE